MTVQPAFEIDLEAHGHAVTLRASLRAAVAIDAMRGGFPQAWEQIARQSFSAIRAVILATATDRQEARRFLAATSDKPLSSFLADAQAACLAVLAALLTPGDDGAADAPSPGGATGKPMPLNEYLQDLYRFATGWLGWSPSEVWNASPAEIETAFAAHTDRLLKLTPGLSVEGDHRPKSSADEYSPERLREIEEQGFDPAFDRSALARLKAQQ